MGTLQGTHYMDYYRFFPMWVSFSSRFVHAMCHCGMQRVFIYNNKESYSLYFLSAQLIELTMSNKGTS